MREGWTEGGASERQFSATVDGLPLGRKHILEQGLLKRNNCSQWTLYAYLALRSYIYEDLQIML